MRSSVIISTSLAAAVLLAGGVAVARVQNASGSQSGTATARTLRLVEHAVTDTTTDTGTRGDSVGDILTFANPVYDAANERKVGSDNGSCIRTRVAKAYECSWTTTVHGGSLVVEGPFYDDSDSTLAIIGGTGVYAQARGQMRLHARNAAGSSYDFTFSVRR